MFNIGFVTKISISYQFTRGRKFQSVNKVSNTVDEFCH